MLLVALVVVAAVVITPMNKGPRGAWLQHHPPHSNDVTRDGATPNSGYLTIGGTDPVYRR